MNTLKLHLQYDSKTIGMYISQLPVNFKVIVHLNMKIMSLLTRPEVVSSIEHKRGYFEEYGYPNS